MLEITIPAGELWNEAKSEFIHTDEQTLILEHSLVSLSKWESKHCKPFLSDKPKTLEEDIDYIRCMTLNAVRSPDCYYNMTRETISGIHEYMEAPMTATWFSNSKTQPKSREVITAERIYYWMTVLNIPFSCETWHLNRLFTLIRVCSEEQKPKKDLKAKDLYKRNSALNAARKRKLGTHG